MLISVEKNMIIGIIAAENAEMSAIKNTMLNVSEEKIYNLNFIKGTIENKNCVLVECGVGKVNAARTTQIMIDKYNVDIVINVGSAGALINELNIEDIVIGKELVQHDFDITGAGNYELGEIARVGKFFKSDERIVKLCEQTINELKNKDFNIKIGRIATGDWFAHIPEKSKQIQQEFEADCIEMEGAAIAQVCFLDKIPFLVIRGISDTPNGNNEIDFHTYLEIVSKRVAEILKNLMLKI